MQAREPHRLSQVREVVQLVEQRPQPPARADPEQRPRRYCLVVVVGVRHATRHPHEIAHLRLHPRRPELEDDPAFFAIETRLRTLLGAARHQPVDQ